MGSRDANARWNAHPADGGSLEGIRADTGNVVHDVFLSSSDRRIATGIAVVAGIVAAFDDAEPTGTALIDVVWIVLAVASFAWIGARGPWWLRTGVAGVAMSLALNPAGIAFGLLGLLIGSTLHALGDLSNTVEPDDGNGPNNPVDNDDDSSSSDLNDGVDDARSTDLLSRVRSHPISSASLVAGLTANSLIRSEMGGFGGASTVLGFGECILIVAFAIPHHGARLGRTLRRSAVAITLFAVVSAVLVALAAVGVRNATGQADSAVQAGIDALDAGDYTAAADHFDEAAHEFRRIENRLGGTFAWPSRFVPGIAQNVGAGRLLAQAGGAMSSEAGSSLRIIDPASIKVSSGRIDLEAIRSMQAPLKRVADAFFDLERTLSDVQSSLIVAPLARRLDALETDVVKQSVRLRNVVDAVDLVPQMLGGDGDRRYLVLFTTPAESRGLGGFPGTWTTVEIADGQIDVADVGRINELNLASELTDCTKCDSEMLARYGRFGLTTESGLVGADSWSNITMPTNFPAIADAATRIFAQATGQPIDGVIVMDPYVIETFVGYAGPVNIPEIDRSIEPDEVADFILEGQYLVDVRLDALDSLSTGGLDAVLGGDLPDPPDMLADLAPLVAERRLLMWTTDLAEQRLLAGTGLIGSLPALDSVDGGFSVAVTNAAANKLDVFLDREVSVSEVVVDGDRRLRAVVRFVNDSPASGLPAYVIGNRVGLPSGSSRLLISFYGPPTLVAMTIDGEPFAPAGLVEDGWMAYEAFVDFESGEAHEFVLDFGLRGDLRDDEFAPTLWEQPLAKRTE